MIGVIKGVDWFHSMQCIVHQGRQYFFFRQSISDSFFIFFYYLSVSIMLSELVVTHHIPSLGLCDIFHLDNVSFQFFDFFDKSGFPACN
ncbi:hypothetical protein SGGMMB4_03967 [Sodalis glossinidius str. 'morsitans']|uniref:Uncharacterized protein n=1 Tax=Sodalis glossinidius (strain morsitans) TaxID=343509 RepID=A0A193QL88_SODGM|nr:hypothetical protein SGGMMB4_03967 [Sodalis glossinidius str. 'morsitans']